MSTHDRYQNYLNELRAKGRCRTVDQGEVKHIDLNFSSNDYLQLKHHPKVIEKSTEYTKRWGTGSGGSRLLLQNCDYFWQLENRIAQDLKKKAALVFSTGYQTSISALAALLDKAVLGDSVLVLSDRMNHASLLKGSQYSGAKQLRYRHLDMVYLEDLLKRYRPKVEHLFIITESLFGMDGDQADMQALTTLAQKYGAFLYVDEAHALGVYGPRGLGLVGEYSGSVEVIMGTFSKALGGAGGFIACNEIIRDYIVNKSSGFMHSTAPSPVAVGAAQQAWELVVDMGEQREYLRDLADYARHKFKAAGFNIGATTSHIIPLIIGNDHRAVACQKALQKRGILIPVIRYPSVPKGAARLRLCLTTAHQKADIDKLISAFKGIESELEVAA